VDFFNEQTRARRKTLWLAFWFALAALGTVVVSYFGVCALTITCRAALDAMAGVAPEERKTLLITIFVAYFFSGSIGACVILFPKRVLLILLCVTLFWIGFYVFMCRVDPQGAEWFLGAMRESFLDMDALLQYDWWNVDRFAWTFLAVGSSVAIGSVYKMAQIARKGVASIMLELGGKRLLRSAQNPLERRLLHVVDEVSIAAGMAPPQVFILENEPGINAFAAGLNASNSVITVTRGTLEQLSRDELQALIAHETSHIINGDARLNLRMIGLLHGLTLLVMPLRLARRVIHRIHDQDYMYRMHNVDIDYGDAQEIGNARLAEMTPPAFLLLLFFPLTVIGAIGVFFGRLMKAAISRQREYLADAAAVQYTRNPEGLIGALRKIARYGSRILNPGAEVVSHMFFSFSGGETFFSRLLTTHPPIRERLARIKRNFSAADFPAPRFQEQATEHMEAEARLEAEFPLIRLMAPESGATQIPDETAATTISAPSPLAYAQSFFAALPKPLLDALASPEGAQAAVYALLLSPKPEIRALQLAKLRETKPEHADACLAYAQWLLEHGPRCRLPLLDMALPTLRECVPEERARLLATVDALIKADGRVSIPEFATRRILKSVLSPRPAGSIRLEQLHRDIAVMLALLAHAGNSDKTAAIAAFRHATVLAPTDGPWEFPEPGMLRPQIVEAALDHLAQANPRFREKLLTACVAAIQHDGKISLVESELLRAFAQSLDCPCAVTGDVPSS
jgi:Zn-dependent protease with chaperone function